MQLFREKEQPVLSFHETATSCLIPMNFDARNIIDRLKLCASQIHIVVTPVSITTCSKKDIGS